MALHPQLYPKIPLVLLWLHLPLQGVLIAWPTGIRDGLQPGVIVLVFRLQHPGSDTEKAAANEKAVVAAKTEHDEK